MIDLTEKNILVTGASRGIGLAIAAQLLDLGATVVCHYNRHPEPLSQLQEKYPANAHLLRADLADEDEVAEMVRKSIAVCKKLDGAVLNAGIAIESKLEAENEKWFEQWRQTMKVNLDAPGIISRELINHFLEKGEGRMVFIASRASHRGDTPAYMAYGASKAGMHNLMKTIARGYGGKNIKAFAIAPGFTRTDMAQDFIDTYGEQFLLDDIALPELTEPGDISPMVALLLSGYADHATGTTIDINAGSYVR